MDSTKGNEQTSKQRNSKRSHKPATPEHEIVNLLAETGEPGLFQFPATGVCQPQRSAVVQPDLTNTLAVSRKLGGGDEDVIITIAVDISGRRDRPPKTRQCLVAFR